MQGRTDTSVRYARARVGAYIAYQTVGEGPIASSGSWTGSATSRSCGSGRGSRDCSTIDGKVGGLAVTIGARVSALAGPAEILMSQTVKDLVAGSGLSFEDTGEHELKGVPDTCIGWWAEPGPCLPPGERSRHLLATMRRLNA
jgi:class 3 adenylate cyclase